MYKCFSFILNLQLPRFNNTLKSNTMRCKKLTTIVLGRKYVSTNAEMLRSITLRQAKTGEHECRNIKIYVQNQIQWKDFNLLKTLLENSSYFGTLAYLFSPDEGSECFFDPKQLLRVSCILWCYYPKCYSITLLMCIKYSKSLFNLRNCIKIFREIRTKVRVEKNSFD